jgi:hypothetical protein
MDMSRSLAALAVTLAVAVPAQAAEVTPPMQLPSPATAAQTKRWLIGVKPGAHVRVSARRVRARTFSVPAGRARAVARELRRQDALLYAEPDVGVRRASVSDFALDGWARGAVVSSNLSWPVPGAAIGVIDDFVDPTTPDLIGQVGYLNARAGSQIEGAHGTEVASAAAAAYNGKGVTGVLPGAPIASWGVPFEATCADVAQGVDASVDAGVKVVNISLGSIGRCFTEYLAVQRAYGAGTLIVAAAGNDYEDGNPVIYPAAFPHVMSVAAVDQQLRSASFSSANAAVDISAPGVEVPLATPLGFDNEDGSVDGFTVADGTSFSSPMVAGAAAWLFTSRPDLEVGQIADVLRFSALDLAGRGYDNDTGWGLLNVEGALAEAAPLDDPLEPNDGITMVNGTVFKGADTPVWAGNGRRFLRGFADQVEDPVDVYRFRLRGRSHARITLKARYGDADLEIFDRGAKTVSDRNDRVCRSIRGLRRTDVCSIVWNGRRTRIGYAAVTVADSDDGITSDYTLGFKRTG